MQNEKKLFAFKLADKRSAQLKSRGPKWKIRDGVAVAGCTDPTKGDGDFMESTYGYDAGTFC